MTAVSFDFGQTLAELDAELLAARVAERGARVDPARLRESIDAAWRHYGEVKRHGQEGRGAWCAFMCRLLQLARVRGSAPAGERVAPEVELAEWLFDQQPHMNLWRKPIPGMFELVASLRRRGIPVAICSNSEGRLEELVRELGQLHLFEIVADSGRLGFEKPDRRIFEVTARGVGVSLDSLVHVGDAWEADIRGALDAGARAIWFRPVEDRPATAGVEVAHDAEQVLQALGRMGVV